MTSPEPFTLSQLAEPASSRRRRWLLPMLIVLAAVLLAAGGAVVWLTTRPSAKPASDVKAQVLQLCHDSGAAQLRSPATARWTDSQIYQTTDGHWHVDGLVDAQNGFGALIRQRFACDLIQSDGHWVPGVTFSDWS